MSLPGPAQMSAAGKQPAPTPEKVVPLDGKVGLGLMISARAIPTPHPATIALKRAARTHMKASPLVVHSFPEDYLTGRMPAIVFQRHSDDATSPSTAKSTRQRNVLRH